MKRLFFLLALLTASSAHAGTWAIVRGGIAYEVVSGGATLDQALAGKRSPDWIDVNKGAYVSVPDTDTGGAPLQSGAARNDNGTFTNPVPVAGPASPISVTDFKKRFSFSERLAMLSSADPGVKVFLDELNSAPSVHLDDPDTVAGVNYMVSLGLLTSQRAAQILTP